MQRIIDSPRASLATGAILAALLLAVWLIASGADGFGLLAFLVRLVHVFSAIVWIGLVVFVNFVQLVALKTADEPARNFLHKAIVPEVAWWFRHASTWAVISGAILLLTAGYVLPSLAYGTSVFVPAARASLLWIGVVGALAMWMFVHMYIWPSMQVVLGLRPGGADAKGRARARVAMFARLNLILALPVTFAMVAAAHLY